ncbi:MAG: CC0125/CC1285 family lipoprotein, partial [Phenylobacterium sp.]
MFPWGRFEFLRPNMSKRSIGIAAALVLAAGLTACATPTPYQPKAPGQSSSGGYSEMRIEPNRFRVSFAGNSVTPREKVEGYLLFRAAELTLQNGDDWFYIDNRTTDKTVRTYVDTPFYGPWYGPGFGYWGPAWRYGGRGGWGGWGGYGWGGYGWGGYGWGGGYDVHTS